MTWSPRQPCSVECGGLGSDGSNQVFWGPMNVSLATTRIKFRPMDAPSLS